MNDDRVIAGETAHVAGVTHDPSPFTALGVFAGIGAAVQHRLGRASLDGLRIAVQGAGSVGTHLCRLLHDAGATLSVADVDRAAVRHEVALTAARLRHDAPQSVHPSLRREPLIRPLQREMLPCPGSSRCSRARSVPSVPSQ